MERTVTADACLCSLEAVRAAFDRDPSMESCLAEHREVFPLLLQYLFHLGLLLAVPGESAGEFFPLVVLDVNWLFCSVVGAFFDIPGHPRLLSRKVREGNGFVSFFLFLASLSFAESCLFCAQFSGGGVVSCASRSTRAQPSVYSR